METTLRSQAPTLKLLRQSAEVIVVDGKRADTFGVKSEYSQVDEGLNIKSVGIQD